MTPATADFLPEYSLYNACQQALGWLSNVLMHLSVRNVLFSDLKLGCISSTSAPSNGQ